MAGQTGADTEGTAGGSMHTGHPTPLTYFKVAMVLSSITAFEVGIFYIEDLGKGIIPILVALSGVKFALVAMFYMHLKYDSRLFSGLFVGGLLLAFSVGLAVLVLFQYFST